MFVAVALGGCYACRLCLFLFLFFAGIACFNGDVAFVIVVCVLLFLVVGLRLWSLVVGCWCCGYFCRWLVLAFVVVLVAAVVDVGVATLVAVGVDVGICCWLLLLVDLVCVVSSWPCCL